MLHMTLYNEERRLGDQRGSDTLVVPLITSNDGLSIAFLIFVWEFSIWPQPTKLKLWLELVALRYARLLLSNTYGLNEDICTSALILTIILACLARTLYVRGDTWLSELCAQFWWDVSIRLFNPQRMPIGHFACRALITFTINFDVKHALGTRLLQKCLRHSPPGVVCTQVWNLKELTEGHHKNAWSMWLNLTQRGKSYRVRTHWGLTGETRNSRA